MHKITVKIDNASGTEWTIEATAYVANTETLIIWGKGGKAWNFPLVHILWWTAEPLA